VCCYDKLFVRVHSCQERGRSVQGMRQCKPCSLCVLLLLLLLLLLSPSVLV
jgi:hypothetical protein